VLQPIEVVALLGKSSRACAPRDSVLAQAEWAMTTGLIGEIEELERATRPRSL